MNGAIEGDRNDKGYNIGTCCRSLKGVDVRSICQGEKARTAQDFDQKKNNNRKIMQQKWLLPTVVKITSSWQG